MKKIIILMLLSISSFSQIDTLKDIFNLPKLPKFIGGKSSSSIIDKSIEGIGVNVDSQSIDTSSDIKPNIGIEKNKTKPDDKRSIDAAKNINIRDTFGGTVNIYIYGGSGIQLNYAPSGTITINDNSNPIDDGIIPESPSDKKKKKGFLSNIDPNKAVTIITLLLATIPIILTAIK